MRQKKYAFWIFTIVLLSFALSSCKSTKQHGSRKGCDCPSWSQIESQNNAQR